jgi:23S rRNA (cytosine1962-C5)-methyltransferase
VDDAFFSRRIDAAVGRRAALPALAGQDGVRLVHGEADGLPGLIVDRYGEVLAVALNSAGAEKWRAAIVGALLRATGAAHVYERSDSDVRRLEGLELRTGVLHGAPPASTFISEHGVRLQVDLVEGHKTGFYLDQRDNRRLTRDLASGRRVLNCFCYTGGFSLQALAGGAREVLSVDSSGPALAAAQASLALNPDLDSARAQWRDADVFELLRELRTADVRFDMVILDPPKFAPSSTHAERAGRAYRDINRLGLQLLTPGGLLMTYSCSGGVSAERFRGFVAAAAADAGVDAVVLQHLQAGPDHPVALAAPEGEYLKGLLLMRT